MLRCGKERPAAGVVLARTGRAVRPRREPAMAKSKSEDHIYKVVELVGSSETSIEDAIQSAITRASATIRHLRWFEVLGTRGHVDEGRVAHYQVMLKVGFTMED
jgi:flavin-binding protein dodecin